MLSSDLKKRFYFSFWCDLYKMQYYCTDNCPCEIDCVASFKTFVSFDLEFTMGNDFRVQSKTADVGLKRPMFGSKRPMSKRPMLGQNGRCL